MLTRLDWWGRCVKTSTLKREFSGKGSKGETGRGEKKKKKKKKEEEEEEEEKKKKKK